MLNMRSLRNLIALVIGTFLISQFTGCSRKPEEGNTARKIVVRFSTWEPAGEGMDVLQDIIDQFEAKYPNIKVKVAQVPGAGYSGKILTQIAGGQAPDVINIAFHTGDLPVYVDKGALLCLEDFAETDPEFNKDDFFPSCIKACSYKGKLYAIPKDGNPYILFYNRTLFEQAGISYPDESWTWDDFLNASRKLTRYDEKGRVVTLGGGYSLGHWYTLITQNKGKVFNDNLSECLLNNPEALSALRYSLKFRQERLIPGTGVSGLSGISGLDLFPTGKIAMWIFCPYRIGDAVKRIKDFEWDIAPIPIPEGGRRFSELIHVGYAISSTTKHPKESWEFVKWLGGPVGQGMMARLKYGVPSIKSVAYSDKYGPPPEHIKVAAEAMEYSELFPAFPGSREIRQKIIQRILDEVDIGLKSPEQGVKEIVEQVNQVLKNN